MPRLLVLEDDADSLEMLGVVLEGAGFEVVGVCSRDAAVKQLHQESFDLVLADFLLESKSSETSWKMVEELVMLARPAPFGLITGWPIPKQLATDHGVAFVLRKPCTRERLLAEVMKTLEVTVSPMLAQT